MRRQQDSTARAISPGQSDMTERNIGPYTWPRNVSHEPRLTIGAVVEVLRQEFPATTVSKVRFLEDQGLVKPTRTAAGYRKYSSADIDRLRFVLTQQRDSYAPLKVIQERLASLDAGHDVETPKPARLISSDGEPVVAKKQTTLSARELGEVTGASVEQLNQYAKLGLITPDLSGYFSSQCVPIVQTILQLSDAGIQPRSLRTVATSALRLSDLVDQVVASRHLRGRPGEKERSRAQAADLTDLVGKLHKDILRRAVESLYED